MLAVILIASIVSGVVVGISFGTRVYQSETIMLYKPQEELKNEIDEAQSLTTQKNLVKIIKKLEDTRRIRKLRITIEKLGSSIEVFVKRETNLKIIRATWNSAEKSAAIVNTIREVFLESQRGIRKKGAEKKITSLKTHLQTVVEQLKKADQALLDFTTSNKVVDLDKEARWYLDELISVNLLFEEAQIEKNTIELQKENFNRITEKLKKRMVKEKTANAELENLEDLDVRLRRLDNSIRKDRGYRANAAELAQKELEFKQARRLQKEGLISKKDFNKARVEYEKQKAVTEDTEQIKEWKSEIARLDKIVIPTRQGATHSGRMLQEIMLREFDIQLKGVALAEKVKHLEKARKKVESKLGTLPALQRRHVALRRDVLSLEEEKMPLEKILADTRRVFESDITDFALISEAGKPVLPLKSNRKLLFISTVFIVALTGFGIVLLLELIDTSIKSEAEIPLKLSLPVIGAVPMLKSSKEIFPNEAEMEPLEIFRIMARHIRNQLPEKGTRLLIASAQNGEGKTSVAANLALSFGRMDELVLLIDSQIRVEESLNSISDLIQEPENPIKGLGEYLSYEADELKEVIFPTMLPGVECLPKIKEAVIPELIGSNRMFELLEKVSKKYAIILIDSPPVLPYVDAETIARRTDGIIFIIRSRKSKVSMLKNAVVRLKKSGTPVLGAILNDVDPLFMNL